MSPTLTQAAKRQPKRVPHLGKPVPPEKVVRTLKRDGGKQVITEQIETAAPQKTIRDPEFGKRLVLAGDGNPRVPAYNKGRLTWVQTQFEERFNTKVSIETVRKWFAGEVKARPDKLKLLAELFEVDESWLSLGVQPDLQPREQKVRNAMASGLVNVLAGFIQMAGGHPAFPEDGDKRAARQHIDLYAVIKGAQYAFHVTLAKQDGKELKFTVPANHEDVLVIAGVPTEGPGVKFFEMPSDWIEATGIRRGGAIEIPVNEATNKLRRITSFADRL